MDPVLLTTFGTLIILLIFTVPIGVSIGTAVFMGMMVGGLPPCSSRKKCTVRWTPSPCWPSPSSS